ncbi:MAG: glycoside hydrolase family 9 protein, partial [Anaerolineae bacterium]|nr:glycoside hydrolase family 9 protein [Anaerolineae bacterium]
MRPLRLLLLLMPVIWSLIVVPSFAQDGAPQLRDLPVFADQRHGMWAGSGNGLNLAVDEGPALPVDEDVTLDGLPSLRIEVTGECCDGWWATVIANENWEAYDLRPYVANGALEFNIRGDANIDNLGINLRDHVNTRDTVELDANTVNLAQYVSLSDEWQAVRIPLQDFVTDSDFEPRQMFLISINNAGDVLGTLWINNLRFTSPDVEPQAAAIKVNQVGYPADAEKVALVSSFTPDFSDGQAFFVLDAMTGAVVYTGELALMTDFDTASGEHVWSADFSDFTTEGTYFLTIEGADESPRFRIGAGVYDDLLVDVMRYYYLQRQGIELASEYAGPFARGVGHPLDSVAEFRSGIASSQDASGGWYDAGDYGKYVNAGALAVSDLLWAYRMFPEQFTDGQSNIPESGNGVPDLLDEVRWELDWMLKMQDDTSGGFWSRVSGTEDVLP